MCNILYITRAFFLAEYGKILSSQSVSQSLPHSYQRSTWSLHTLIFCTSVRWNLSILWFLLAGLALQVDLLLQVGVFPSYSRLIPASG